MASAPDWTPLPHMISPMTEVEGRSALSPEVGTTRVEAFSDSVMAVIITIMAFELRPPQGAGLDAMRDQLPGVLVYAELRLRGHLLEQSPSPAPRCRSDQWGGDVGKPVPLVLVITDPGAHGVGSRRVSPRASSGELWSRSARCRSCVHDPRSSAHPGERP